MQVPASDLVATAHTTSRIEALTDGVFAIVLTLVVFDIRAPLGPPEQLGASLLALWPRFLVYAISFLQLGIYWAGHRSQFNFIVREDHVLRWISLLFLALVALIPFSTQLLANYIDERLALGIYAANFIALGLVLALHWAHATRHSRLVEAGLPAAVKATGFRRCLAAPLLYAAAFIFSTVSPVAAIVLYGLVPACYIFPALIDRLGRVYEG
ncbi:MAG: TMEM175 family protein [Trueperaceae bacterium]